MQRTGSTTLGSAVRAAREGKGWSRATLARQAGVAAGTVANVELYGTAPRWDTVEALAKALELDVEALLRSSSSPKKGAAA